MRSRTDFASAYARFRGGRAFLIVLAAVLAVWIVWNEVPFLPHFDGPEFGRLNLFLSTEASLSVALLIMASEKREAAQREQLTHLCRLAEMTEALVEAQEKRGSA